MEFLCARSRLRTCSCETVSVIPSRVSPHILHTHAESGAYSWALLTRPAFRDGFHLYRQPPSGQSRVYRVTQLPIDSVYPRQSAGTRLEDFKVAQVTCVDYSRNSTDQSLCALLFPRPLLLVQWTCLIQTTSIRCEEYHLIG